MSSKRSRRLVPATIIPEHLYVTRNADRQIQNVILEMGRPGYVLVARQMGKTNLLLHARNELEDQGTIFVYFDLSQRFDNERQCFRSIIDTALQANVFLFGSIQNLIIGTRSTSLSPQQEHELELRHLLTRVQNRLIIILDEIDSLTSSTFSDRIFAQIRSVYFAGRTNFPDFHKLSYLLSGVVEPSDIIKDPRISPFNIGEKIYLDDFTQSEMLSFLEKAALELDSPSIERLWYWTGGNPRILWDVCSELENHLLQGELPTPERINDVVQYLYLNDFSRPPVDHIRQLVEHDDELRGAVDVIRYGQGGKLGESIKTKLYLSGITSSRLHSPKCEIKNQIISHALSDSWLREMAVKKKGLILLAFEQFSKSNYKEALSLYTEYLKHNTDIDEATVGICIKMAWCHKYLGQSEQALNVITANPADKQEAPYEYYEQRFLEASCFADIGKKDLAKASYSEIINGNRQDYTGIISMVNLAALISLENNPSSKEEAGQLYARAIEKIDNTQISLKGSERKRLRARARWSYAKFLIDKPDVEFAKQILKTGLHDSIPEDRPSMQIVLGNLSQGSERVALFKEASDLIIQNRILPDYSTSGSQLSVKVDDLYFLISELFFCDRNGYNRLADYVINVPGMESSRPSLLLSVGAYRIADLNIAEPILNEALEANPNEQTRLKIQAILSLRSKSEKKRFNSLFGDYLMRFSSGESLSNVEFLAIAEFLAENSRKGQYTKVLTTIAHIEALRSTVQHELLINFATIYFFKMLALSRTGRVPQLRQTADTTLIFLNEMEKGLEGSSLNRRDFEAIRQFAEQNSSQRNLFAKVDPIHEVRPKIPRNSFIEVRYLDGSVRRDKYKRLEEDLDAHKCEIVTDTSTP